MFAYILERKIFLKHVLGCIILANFPPLLQNEQAFFSDGDFNFLLNQRPDRNSFLRNVVIKADTTRGGISAHNGFLRN